MRKNYTVMKNKTYCYEYPRPAVTTDNVIFGFDQKELKILLIQRGIDPYKGKWALPGGFLNEDEDADAGARRELEEETGLKDVYPEQLYTYTSVNRDPRHRTISIAYYTLVKSEEHTARPGDDAQKAQWFAVSEIPELAFDHKEIIQTGLERLKIKIKYKPIGLELLPEKFTLSDLQLLYDSILQKTSDRNNFEKRILKAGLLTNLNEKDHEGAGLYSFNRKKYKELSEQGFYLEF